MTPSKRWQRCVGHALTRKRDQQARRGSHRRKNGASPEKARDGVGPPVLPRPVLDIAMPGVGTSGKNLRFNSGFAHGEMIEWDDELQCSIKSMPEHCVFLLVRVALL